MQLKYCFLAPALTGVETGGTRYNRELVHALNAASEKAQQGDRASTYALYQTGWSGVCWVDSLYFDEVANLRKLDAKAKTGLLLHYLPSLVKKGAAFTAESLEANERDALANAEAIWVTSRFMQQVLVRLKVSQPVLVVEPGCEPERLEHPPKPTVPSAAILANLLPGKGILEYLEALSEEVRPTDNFELTVIGSHGLDPKYAAACVSRAEARSLRGRVRFTHALTPKMASLTLQHHHFCISTSHMESYGMALAEARTLGLPILALEAGNVSSFIELDAGGELTKTTSELCEASLRLFRHPDLLAERTELATARAWAPRPWAKAASEFESYVGKLGLR